MRPRLTHDYYPILRGVRWTCRSRLAESFGLTQKEAYSEWRKTWWVVIGAWTYFLVALAMVLIPLVWQC